MIGRQLVCRNTDTPLPAGRPLAHGGPEVLMTAVDREQRQDFVETAAEHIHARIPVFAPDVTVRAVRASLAGRRFDSVADVAVGRGTRLVGLARIEDVLAAADDTLLSTLMDPDPPVVAAGTDQEVAAWHAVQRGACSGPRRGLPRARVASTARAGAPRGARGGP